MIKATNVKVTMFQQIRFPRTKNRRIRKKWFKDKGNWKESEVKGVRLFSSPGAVVLPRSVVGDVKISYRTTNCWNLLKGGIA